MSLIGHFIGISNPCTWNIYVVTPHFPISLFIVFSPHDWFLPSPTPSYPPSPLPPPPPPKKTWGSLTAACVQHTHPWSAWPRGLGSHFHLPGRQGHHSAAHVQELPGHEPSNRGLISFSRTSQRRRAITQNP